MLAGCGIEESELLWMIDDKGSFLFGQPAGSAPLPSAEQQCLMKWIDEKDVRSAALGYGAAR